MVKRRVQEVGPGDVFQIPLTDETFSIGQVVANGLAMNSALCLFFSVRASPAAIADTPLSKKHLIAAQFVTPELLESGVWAVIRRQHVVVNVNDYIPYRDLEERRFIGVDIIGGGIIRKFLNAYFGLAPWDKWADPSFLDRLLVRGAKRPANVILTKQSE